MTQNPAGPRPLRPSSTSSVRSRYFSSRISVNRRSAIRTRSCRSASRAVAWPLLSLVSSPQDPHLGVGPHEILLDVLAFHVQRVQRLLDLLPRLCECFGDQVADRRRSTSPARRRTVRSERPGSISTGNCASPVSGRSCRRNSGSACCRSWLSAQGSCGSRTVRSAASPAAAPRTGCGLASPPARCFRCSNFWTHSKISGATIASCSPS